ncbi:MAG: putative glycoside hydrolase [Treponemataceae bacterium]|nr:putative glycoside hydrolase [Treponemataceae bacterium]
MELHLIKLSKYADKEFMKYRIHKISAILVLTIALPIFFSNAQKGNSVEEETVRNESVQVEDLPQIKSEYEGTLLASETGLYRVKDGILWPLWTEGSVSRIVKGKSWFFLTSNGILKSDDLVEFTNISEGLPILTIKRYENGVKYFEKQTAALKDLKMHPQNPDVLVTMTRDEVFITRDGGKKWWSLGFCAKTNGAKSIAVATMQDTDGAQRLTVFISHPLYGLAYIQPDRKNAKWTDINTGYDKLPTMSDPDEVADIITVCNKDDAGNVTTDVYFSQSYLPCLYKLDWAGKKAIKLGQDKTNQLDTFDSLFVEKNKLYFVCRNGFNSFDLATNTFCGEPEEAQLWETLSRLSGRRALCLYIPENVTSFSKPVVLNEMWLFDMANPQTKYADVAMDKKGLYIPAGQNNPGAQLQGFIDIAKENKLNTVVVDMKDDYGLLRYKTDNAEIKKKATISSYAIDIEKFVKQCKENNIYLVARIVVFKDRNLWRYGDNKYAVVDYKTGEPWRGIRGYDVEKDENGEEISRTTNYYDEYWVDPYSEEVWEYNIEIAKDLVSKGFDEIQFDYIRFPTDGLNLSNVKYRWRDEGMDKESALISFLSYARENLDAPIGIDIYGQNGWYRSGTRTGQDVELLSPYVDVICPMFYPSHFEQYFLAQSPAVERPYRIYYYGCYRNTVIARNQVIVRPWVQAFYLAVSYDKTYYGTDYIKREIFGVRDSVNRGYMYWNNSGKYDYISPDPEDTKYPW